MAETVYSGSVEPDQANTCEGKQGEIQHLIKQNLCGFVVYYILPPLRTSNPNLYNRSLLCLKKSLIKP